MLTGENKNTVHEQVCELGSLSWHELYIVLEDTCTIRFMITRTLSYQEGWLILLISDHLDISYSGAPEFILSLLWGSYCPIFRFQCSVFGYCNVYPFTIYGTVVVMIVWSTTYVINVYHHQSCEFEFCSWHGVLDTTLCDEVCQWLVWFLGQN